MTHWHDDNPWAARAVYVSIDELAECLMRSAEARKERNPGYPVQPASKYLDSWKRLGNALDAYILPSDRGEHQVGVRYGSKPDAYLSLYVPDESVVEELLNRYTIASGPTP
jgi:hypothetical protein